MNNRMRLFFPPPVRFTVPKGSLFSLSLGLSVRCTHVTTTTTILALAGQKRNSHPTPRIRPERFSFKRLFSQPRTTWPPWPPCHRSWPASSRTTQRPSKTSFSRSSASCRCTDCVASTAGTHLYSCSRVAVDDALVLLFMMLEPLCVRAFLFFSQVRQRRHPSARLHVQNVSPRHAQRGAGRKAFHGPRRVAVVWRSRRAHG